jgi:hypothetical protein
MNRLGFLLASLFTFLVTASATGQTKEIQDEIARKLDKARAAGRMEEHIEVFRRLLNRELHAGLDVTVGAADTCPALRGLDAELGYYPPRSALVGPRGGPNQPNLGDDAATKYGLGGKRVGDPNRLHVLGHGGLEILQPLPIAEGVYLKGHGVIYTATLPLPARSPVAITEKPETKPLTAWELERRELRGEKPPKPAKASAGPPSVSETILRLLAENGKHFTELAADEQLTVAVVFRPGGPFGEQLCTKCHQAFRGAPQSDSSGASTTTGTSDKTAPVKPAESVVGMFRNDMALADLHLKQGKPRDAAEVYRKVIESCNALLVSLEENAGTGSSEWSYAVTVGVEAHAKLAQAQIAAGDTAGALKTLHEAARFHRMIEKLGAAPKPDKEPAPPALPARLVISVWKRTVDRFATGEMRFDEFCKAAAIEYTGADKDAKP